MRFLTTVVLLSFSSLAWAGPYTPSRGLNAPTVSVSERYEAEDGSVQVRQVERKAAADSWGNAAGNQYDLVVDGAFDGQTVAVLHFYTGEGFDFSLPKAALAEKGFSTYRWANQAPSPEELASGLEKANQLWVISGSDRKLTDAHLDVIQEFWQSGHGVYIWGDNQPYYADANAVADRLFEGGMDGNLMGNQTVTVVESMKEGKPGLAAGHDITTGLEHLYEGITIATLRQRKGMDPLLVGSEGNLVAATYDHAGRRAVLDGGFTRLYINWDTAGTARYVKNAASWLANYERFGDAVLAKDMR